MRNATSPPPTCSGQATAGTVPLLDGAPRGGAPGPCSASSAATRLLSVKERLLATLLEIAEREGQHESGREVIVFTRPTHQELADRIGSSREVVTRILKELLESGAESSGCRSRRSC